MIVFDIIRLINDKAKNIHFINTCRSIRDSDISTYVVKLTDIHHDADILRLMSYHVNFSVKTKNFTYITNNIERLPIIDLDLSDSDIEDVSMLGHLRTLNLSFCKNVSDVSALGNVHTLDLSCTYITD